MFWDARSCATSPAACQVVPLVSCLRSSKDHVANAGTGKVVSDRAADDAAANNDDLSAGRKRVFCHSDVGKGCQ